MVKGSNGSSVVLWGPLAGQQAFSIAGILALTVGVGFALAEWTEPILPVCLGIFVIASVVALRSKLEMTEDGFVNVNLARRETFSNSEVMSVEGGRAFLPSYTGFFVGLAVFVLRDGRKVRCYSTHGAAFGMDPRPTRLTLERFERFMAALEARHIPSSITIDDVIDHVT